MNPMNRPFSDTAFKTRSTTLGGDGRQRAQCGFSLIELMIGMTLGLMLVAVVASIFVSSNRNYKEDDRFARMQENGRFAVNALITDLSMASFWGTMSNPTKILSSLSSVSTGADCGLAYAQTTTSGIVAADPVRIVNNPSSGAAANSVFGCIASADVWTGGSTHADVIGIKRVLGEQALASAVNTSNVYLEIDSSAGALVSIAPSGFNGLKTYWRYTPRIYYIRNYSVAGDGIPTLCRKELSGTTMSDVPLVEGIENIQIEFGIDTDGDGAPNKYDANPTSAADLKNLVNAKVYVLARSLDQDPTYTNKKTYNLGNVSLDYSSAPDHYYRRVFEGTISLRNVSGFSLMGEL